MDYEFFDISSSYPSYSEPQPQPDSSTLSPNSIQKTIADVVDKKISELDAIYDQRFQALEQKLDEIKQTLQKSAATPQSARRQQVSRTDPSLVVIINNQKQSLEQADFQDIIKAIESKQEGMVPPPELNMPKIRKQFGGQLVEAFKRNRSTFGFLIAQALMEKEVFQNSFMPKLSATDKSVQPRSASRRQCNDQLVEAYKFLIDYFGGSIVEEQHHYRLRAYVRETYNDRVRHSSKPTFQFSVYGDNSKKPFNQNNSFI